MELTAMTTTIDHLEFLTSLDASLLERDFHIDKLVELTMMTLKSHHNEFDSIRHSNN